ncbi:winged helix-turn-helix domain-containing protein [Caulobacter endophyticus]|uniref:winged helix-turn-helix domain-containing protein n=1 Tax=Caulobacter endophyticus TaxID=2172652 RepID=UPI00240F78BC|nr:transcriptional regulator [Caulobacter endophyticus]MDG2527662.1 transcriptional regulator [Caulobacter endophyticus]
MPGRYRFERFTLDLDDRRLTRDGETLALNARYLDALALLVREEGRLVSKERFLDEVWAGVPVTDEALTQCVRTLRRLLDDPAAAPRFIATVPKHGYRFVAPVEQLERDAVVASATQAQAAVRPAWTSTLLLGAAGTGGGGAAGAIGGIAYGFAGAAQASQAGAASVLLVMLILCVLVGLAGGLGVGFGIAISRRAPGPWWRDAVGGAIGGLLIGAAFKLLGLDAFNLLLGRAPGGIAGAFEGLAIGAAVGLGAGLARQRSLRRGMALAGLCGAIAGAVVTLLGGRLMAGSLDLLSDSFPGSRLRLDVIGALLGEQGLGPISLVLTGALEGLLFSACVVGAMTLAARRSRSVS